MAFSQENYKNPNLCPDARANDLLKRMTIEEKFWQLFMLPYGNNDRIENYSYGIFGFQFSTEVPEGENQQILNYLPGQNAYETAKKINEIQKYIIENTRLGIPIIAFDEALHGLIRDGSTMFPQSIGLAATFDTTTMREVSKAIANEVKSRGIRQILSPVINIADDPRWGRTEETYGSDPYLVSLMGYVYISSLENAGIVSTPKHFIANSGDGGRDSYPIHINKRLLYEKYLPPFEMAVKKGKARSIMTAYNSYDGTPCTQNSELLIEILKEQWAFKGFVISDASATGGANVLHMTTDSYSNSTKQAIENGLDVIFQTSFSHYPLFYEAFEKKIISASSIDSAVKRVLVAKFELGLFENPYVDTLNLKNKNFHQIHKEINLEASRKSVVLLQNNGILPLKKSKKILVVGEDAIEARPGGYSRAGQLHVSILQGIKSTIGEENVMYAKGSFRNYPLRPTIEAPYLTHIENGEIISGLKAEYFNNITQKGKPIVERIDPSINFSWTLYPPDPKLNLDFFSVRWTGQINIDSSGFYKIGIEGNDGFRLFINDSLVIDCYSKISYRSKSTKIYLNHRIKNNIKVEFYETTGNSKIHMFWDTDNALAVSERLKEAINKAEQSDAIIFVAGIEEGEFRDRASLSLPGNQEQVIQALTNLGKPIIIILCGGSAIKITPAIENTDAIIDAWYPGDEGGTAISEIIFGDYNPAGRLPIEFPMSESQLPYSYSHKPTGRGNDYMDLSGRPYYPFGFGLSYTKFEYSDLRIENLQLNEGSPIIISFLLKNIGDYDGEEVVQVYLHDQLSSVSQPIQKLVAFKRVFLRKSESKRITMEIESEQIEIYNKTLTKVIEPGVYVITVGGSSQDIRLRGQMELKKN